MEIQRLRGQIRTLERGNEADMLEMGRFLYEKYQAGEAMDEQVQMLCEKSITEQKVSRDIRQRSRRSKERVLVQNVEKQVAKRDGILSVLRSEKRRRHLG